MQFGQRVPPHPSPLPKEREPFWETHHTVTINCAVKWFSLSLGGEGWGEGEWRVQLHRYGLKGTVSCGPISSAGRKGRCHPKLQNPRRSDRRLSCRANIAARSR